MFFKSDGLQRRKIKVCRFVKSVKSNGVLSSTMLGLDGSIRSIGIISKKYFKSRISKWVSGFLVGAGGRNLVEKVALPKQKNGFHTPVTKKFYKMCIMPVVDATVNRLVINFRQLGFSVNLTTPAWISCSCLFTYSKRIRKNSSPSTFCITS